MDSMQLPLIGGLLALLLLLLLVRSVGRRRARRAAEPPASGAVAAPAEVETDVPDVVAHVEAVEADVQPEPPVATDFSWVAAEPEPQSEAYDDPQVQVVEDEAVPELDEPEQPEQPVEPVARKRRGLFGRRRRRREAAAAAALAAAELDPALDPVQDPALDPVVDGDAVEAPAAELDETASAAADDAEVAETPEQELKALREQLRALELVVQQQSADHPTAALAKVEETVAEQSAAYLRQVSLVVSGLAAHTSEDENPRRTLARVAAAVERLGVPNSMERPILPVSHELTSRSHDGSHHPSHLMQPQELGAGADASDAAPTRVTDVFAGLDAAVAPANPVHPAAPAAGAGVAEPLLPPVAHPPVVQQPVQQPAQQPVHQPLVQHPVQPPAPPVPDATATMPVFGQPTGNVHDLSALAAYEGGYDGGYEAAADGGIPAFEEPPAVLPVPPPAAPESSRKRRGRRSKSS